MDLRPSPQEMKVRAERQKSPNEEAATETTGALKDQYGNCYLDVPRAVAEVLPPKGDLPAMPYPTL
jgi:hypothetical protein